MDESEDNMSSEDLRTSQSPQVVKSKPKKRSLIERELETSLTSRVTSPVSINDGTSTSRYGRARRLKTEIEQSDAKKVTTELKSPLAEKSPTKTQSPVYKMHASNSPLRSEPPKVAGVETFLENQIESIYQENISLSRFGSEEVKKTSPSPAKKFPKVYIRKDLIQKRESDESVVFIKNMFSPVKSANKSSSTHLNNILERSSERYSLGSTKQQNGFLDNSSVVKTLDFDCKKKKKEQKDTKTLSKSDLFDLEAKCAYQVGDLAWARMGTYPFWPSIVTRDPSNGVFVKKKLFGRIERDVIHVTFFGDNGRRGWIVDTMLRKYLGHAEFESTRENFTPEDKKKDPRLYAAFFISEKKQALWNNSVEEAESLFREPKRLRIDIFNEMLEKARTKAKQQKSGKISRTDSDVSLSESLYDSLFSEDDGKTDNTERARNRTRNKSLDVFEVVTACLDNMAAKTGITKIQRQSHMDRWLQKAKSKTPEKTQAKPQAPQIKEEKKAPQIKEEKKAPQIKEEKKETKVISSKKKKSLSKLTVNKPYRLRKSMTESQNVIRLQNEHDYSKNVVEVTDSDHNSTDTDSCKNFASQEPTDVGIVAPVESSNNKTEEIKKEEEVDEEDKESEKNAETVVNEEESKVECSKNEESINREEDCKVKSPKDKENVVNEEKSKVESPKNEETTVNDEDSKVDSPKETDPKVNGTCDFSESENMDEDAQNSIISTPSSPGINNTSQGLFGAKVSFSLELAAENAMDTVITRDQTISPVYEDSFNDSQISHVSAIDGSHMEDEEPTPKFKPSEKVTAESQDEMTNDNDDSTVSTDEPSYMSVDEDSDYKPDNDTDSQTDNCSLSDAPLTNDSLDPPNDTDDDSISAVIKKKVIIETESSNVSLDKLNKDVGDISDITNDVPSKLIEEPNLKDDIKATVAESIPEELSNGVSCNDFDIIKQSTVESTNQSNFPDAVNKIRDDIPNCDVVESITSKGPMNGLQNVKVDMNTAKEIHIPISKPEIRKENGFHDEDAHMNGDIDLDTVSIHSEDSVTSTRSESRRRLRSKQDKKPENPLENAEFLKYFELRQDAIMDENPELTQEEIVAYLYKTWLYEENSKSDDKKNDDLRELNLVKGLNVKPEPNKRTRERDERKQRSSHKKHSLSLNKNMMQKFLHTKTRGERKMVYTDVDSNFQINDPYSDDIDEVPSPAYEPLDDDLPEISSTNSNSIQETFLSKETEIALGTPTLIEPQEKKDVSVEVEVSKKNDCKVILTRTDEKNIDKNKEVSPIDPSKAVQVTFPQEPEKSKVNDDCDADSVDSEDSETPLIRCKLRSKAKKENSLKEDVKIKDEEGDTISINSESSEKSTTRRKQKFLPKKVENALEDPEFVKYLELRQDSLIDENPQLTQDEIVSYLYQTWLYEENNKSEIKKNDDIEQSSLVKGLKDPVKPAKKVKRKIKTEKESEKEEKKETEEGVVQKDKPKRKVIKPYYNEEFSDIEEELEVFSIFKPKTKQVTENGEEFEEPIPEGNDIDEVELYFEELAQPKPNVFKGLIREKVCEICEMTGNLVKCKGCNGMFHVDCVNKEEVEIPQPSRGRKKKRKANRKPKSSDEFDSQDDKSQDVSEDASIEDIVETEIYTVDADTFEAQLEAKMKELLQAENDKIDYDSYSSDDGCDWSDTKPGKCEIIDVKLKPRRSNEADYSNFKCKNCQKYDTPVCFVCKSAVSKNESSLRQKCHVAHCHKYYHLKCLDHWPQTQFNGGEPSKTNKKINEYFEALTCPRHVCHTCVSDDPRGCKTRFSGDKLARCVRCPATYHSFTKCLPAGTLILTASHIICPRHYEHRPGKVPCHVNTGWCFICAQGGSLICCEYCPTSFHAECLNIKPPEGGYMCEDCETGRLPLYGEMVWVKLGHYRWWPGIILHPTEIPENIMAVKHNPGEFVVRFFGQYDHYWVNRGRVFPFQEGDSGRISNQKSKIDAAFTTAMEHAQRACEILKSAAPNEEESLDIASSLLPPHYVKLKVNKPCGSLCGRKLEDPESSLTQCECNPNDEDPCGAYSQCLNRMLLTECGPTCRAGERCNNRAFEKRLYPKLVPYRTPSRGWGLKTLEDIKAGQFVIEYVGELIDEQEFRRRMVRKHEIRDENFYFLTLDKERMIDAGPKGNLARFMNHCCEPNCETQKWTVLGDVRVGLFALYDIPANSEVTFNYNLECAGIEKKRCMCGAKRCSGYIGAKPKQDESQSKKPKIAGKRTYKKRKPTEESPSTKNQPKRPIGRPPKPRELTEIEKDLLIIRNATNGISSDESSRSMSSEYERNPKALKRKRVSFSTEEIILYDGSKSPSVKKHKLEEKTDVGD
ncbi:hypothetical protein PYW07_009979 [Mythimna separata]|uniref:Uncharacterized protein n=1 Tax=Mythimna separata TaxID=271217 RepID=A0AAD7YH59_MYTSE|nr:hypothetical protein PYW07_009979 [Mythimna separata]